MNYVADASSRSITAQDVNSYKGSFASTTGHERAVHDPPALWHYSQSMLVFHAAAADKEGSDPCDLIKFLLSQRDFAWWTSTREDMQDGATISYFAARWDLVSWLACLVQHEKLEIHERGGTLIYPALVAARMGNSRALSFMLSNDIVYHIGYRTRERQSLLHQAVLSGDYSIVNLVCRHTSYGSSEFYRRDINGLTALHLASIVSPRTTISRLLEFGMEAWALDEQGNTCLHLACSRKEPDILICEALIEAGCETTALNNSGTLPFEVALSRGNWDLVEHLNDPALWKKRWGIKKKPWRSKSLTLPSSKKPIRRKSYRDHTNAIVQYQLSPPEVLPRAHIKLLKSEVDNLWEGECSGNFTELVVLKEPGHEQSMRRHIENKHTVLERLLAPWMSREPGSLYGLGAIHGCYKSGWLDDPPDRIQSS